MPSHVLQYATAQAPLQRDAAGTEHNGPDPLFTFRCQRMLQRTDMALWEQTNQLDQPGERLEAAFAMLFPSLVPQGWEKPVLAEKTPVQKPAQSAIKGRAVKGTATPASSGPKDTEPGTMTLVVLIGME